MLLWVGAAALFRAYLLAGPEHRPDSAPPTRTSCSSAERSASIGTVVWMYLSALAVLTGAQLNGELSRSRRNTPEAARSGRTGQPRDPTEQTDGVSTRTTKGFGIVPGLHTWSSEMRRATERRRCGATASKAS